MENALNHLEQITSAFSAFMWGIPLVVLIVGGGLYFACHSRFLPYRHLGHSLGILRGDYDNPADEGDISHRQALTTALSGTLGLGNIAGVAVAIGLGGPGAVFWMWITAVVGIATKFYTCSLAVMFRGRDSLGQLQGGPMYVVREGLGRRWLPLAGLFALAGMFGTLPVFQANQLVQLLRETVAEPAGLVSGDQALLFNLLAGAVLAVLVAAVIVGRIQRIGAVTVRLVPAMVALYLGMTAFLLISHYDAVPAAFALIFRDAFTGQAAAGGVLGTVILLGVQRGAFSNEAGIGTEALAHGAARTNEPVREGVVAMLGPVIDTLIVCTCTALAILVTGVWQTDGLNGVTLTATAFESAIPVMGAPLLLVMVFFLSLSTMVSYCYYGSKCFGFLVGARHQHHYVWLYAALIIVGSAASLQAVIGLIDGMYAVMAIPTMASAILLSPRVRQEARRYFGQMRAGGVKAP